MDKKELDQRMSEIAMHVAAVSELKKRLLGAEFVLDIARRHRDGILDELNRKTQRIEKYIQLITDEASGKHSVNGQLEAFSVEMDAVMAEVTAKKFEEAVSAKVD